MYKLNNLKFLILIWCLLTRAVYLSIIPVDNYQNDEDTTNKLKNILLRKLDFEDEPAKLGDTNVPNYLLDLFETNSLFQNNRIFLSNNSNTIRSHPVLNNEFFDNQINFKKQNKSGFLIKFNLTLPDKEILNSGELRIFLNLTSSIQCASNKQRITINQIIQQLVNLPYNEFLNQYINNNIEDNLIYRQIDALTINLDEPKWLQFDVLPAVESWIQKSSNNLGLLIKSNCVNSNNFNLNENEFIDNLIFKSTNQNDNLNPVLLTYSTIQNLDYEVDNLDFINKKKRHINQEYPLTAVQNKNDWKNGKNKDCARYSMYVDFHEIGWTDWIVAPKGYDAFLCYGDCSLSVVRNGNTTNHATMQSLSNGIQPNLVPPACCVPIEFMPLTMIYNEGKQSVLKIYEDMIVTKCGCK